MNGIKAVHNSIQFVMGFQVPGEAVFKNSKALSLQKIDKRSEIYLKKAKGGE
jgi:hypothetical protein